MKNIGNQSEQSSLLAKAESVSGLISLEANAIENEATITPAVYNALAETELFWMMVPTEAGGAGADITTAVEVIEEITRADGSTGWSLMANAVSTGIIAAHLDEAGVDEFFRGPHRAIIAGQLGPIGYGAEVDGGLKVRGRFQFASGSAYSTHLAAGVHLRDENDNPRFAGGMPDARVAVVPRDKVIFHGNWDVMGLVGTGSYDYELPEQVVSDSATIAQFSPHFKRGGPTYALGLLGVAVAGHTGVALGLMKRALEEVVRATDGKVRLGYSEPVLENPVFKHGFTVNEAAYQAARAYALQAFSDVERTAAEGKVPTPEQHARVRQASVWAHNVMDQVVGFCHLWGGTAAFRNPSALGRCTRDAVVATQHALLDQIWLVDAAAPIIEATKARSR